VTPLVITRLNGNELAPRGSLVRVTCGTDRYASRERWFAVGIYFQKLAEAAVCSLPQIEPTAVVFARRPLKPAEIETLGLRRGQVIPAVSMTLKSHLELQSAMTRARPWRAGLTSPCWAVKGAG
jgi:hypothetical protein